MEILGMVLGQKNVLARSQINIFLKSIAALRAKTF